MAPWPLKAFGPIRPFRAWRAPRALQDPIGPFEALWALFKGPYGHLRAIGALSQGCEKTQAFCDILVQGFKGSFTAFGLVCTAGAAEICWSSGSMHELAARSTETCETSGSRPRKQVTKNALQRGLNSATNTKHTDKYETCEEPEMWTFWKMLFKAGTLTVGGISIATQ